MTNTNLNFIALPKHRGFKDKTGLRSGRLLVLGLAEKKGRAYRWQCLCDCGSYVTVDGNNLFRNCFSCGCYRSERVAKQNTKHSMCDSPTYNSWRSMLSRCKYPSMPSYERYKARGITVCDRWQSFEIFLADMGERPEGTSIDRIDNNKGYSPDNCRWATPLEQQNNTESNHLLTFKDQTLSVTQWAKRLGCLPPTLFARLRMGWGIEKTLSTPIRPKSK